MSLLLPPLSHYLDDSATTSTTPTTPTKPTKKKGLTRSATLASRFKHTAEPKPPRSLQRSLSVSATGQAPAVKQDGHWDECAPWEMYFDPNYTFFGGTVLDARHRKRQQDVLKAMALNDYHLHLHPPPSAAASTAADQLQQPSLPYAVMDSVHHQHYADPLEQNLSPTSVQTMYYPAESSPMSQQDHQQRLALLQAIRTEAYQPVIKDTPKTASTQVVPAVVPSQPSRRHRDPSQYIWMEMPSPTQEEKTNPASTFDLTSFQETGHVASPHKLAKASEQKERRYRTSFLYFLFGFLFPPVWVIGALYTPPEHQQGYQSSHGRRIDLMWKRACRMAFALFTFGLLVMVVIILALNPGALGWRTSRTDLNSAQQFIPVVAQ